jgi:hypothetical protein
MPDPSERQRAAYPASGTPAQAAAIPVLAVTSTEDLETRFHRVPKDAYPYSARRDKDAA